MASLFFPSLPASFFVFARHTPSRHCEARSAEAISEEGGNYEIATPFSGRARNDREGAQEGLAPLFLTFLPLMIGIYIHIMERGNEGVR